MTRQMSKRRHAHAFVTSAVGTTVMSIVAAWLFTATLPDLSPSSAEHRSHQPATGPLYRLSPLPPGADWTA
jgi:hypothetical protein